MFRPAWALQAAGSVPLTAQARQGLPAAVVKVQCLEVCLGDSE